MLITPVLIALVFGLVQTALVWNARHTVGAAAQHGARLARTANALNSQALADPVAGRPGTARGSAGETAFETLSDQGVRDSTLSFLRQTGGSGLQHPTVTIRHAGGYVTVTVSGSTVGVLPGTTVRVSGTSRTPVEGFRR